MSVAAARSRLPVPILVIAMAASSASAVPRATSPPARPARAGIIDLSQRIDTNDLGMVVTNIGSFAYNIQNGTAGLEFPRGSGKTAMFAGGLWLGARVNGETRVALSEYSSEFGPGAMLGIGPDDPNNAAYKVYKLRRDDPDPATLADYQAGAVPYGAPPVTILPDNTLDIPGDQMLWSVYNDADPANHFNNAGSTLPLGVEVQQTTFAFDDPGPLGRTIYLTYRIINKGANTLDSLYVGLWSDVDLGGAGDDLAGSVWYDQLGYVYNATSNDFLYGSLPPAVGLNFIEWGRPYTASFAVYGGGTDPNTAEQTYLWLRGRKPDGTPIVDPASGTAFMFAGDPVTQTGSLDVNPQDRRILLSVGAAVMAPGDTITATWAVVVGQENDRLSSVARLRCDASSIKNFWLNRHLNPPPPTSYGCAALPSCPRSSSFWVEQCGPARDFDPAQMDTIAGRVDNRSAYFGWTGNPIAALCEVLNGPDTERGRAEREFASLLATLSVGTMLPASGKSVSLTNVPIACDGLEANTIVDLAGPAAFGLRADYLNAPPHPVPIAGIGLGPGPFGGGTSTGDLFFGSRLNPVDSPDSFPRVELRFGSTQLASRYLRYETLTGDIPSNYPQGRAYPYGGRHSVPFTVWDADHNVQLEVAFTERVVVDEDGTIQPAQFQPATFDSTWMPDTTAFGSREFVLVFSYPYGAGQAELTAPDAFLSTNLPTLYVMGVRRLATDSQFDAGDVFFFEWGPLGPSVDALMLQLAELPAEQANPVYQQIADCLYPINRAVGIGPTCDLETAVLISLVRADAGPDGIALAWYATEPVSVGIERRVDGGGWTQVGTRVSDGAGRITFDDHDVSEGHRYSYRLRYRDDQGERVAGETSVDLPSTARTGLTGFVPNPARGTPGVAFSLASDGPATLAIHDVAGRRVGSFEVGRLGRGAHVFKLDGVSLSSGVYLLRLTQNGHTVTAQSAWVR